jgi:sarcosine oxidase, subunit delta
VLKISCPWCGPRDEPEFRWGGELVVRPAPQVSDEQWAEYLFYRENPRGLVRERWLHAFGCRQWFIVVRDTATQEIRRTYAIAEAPAELPG